jgi:hypothetical protein
VHWMDPAEALDRLGNPGDRAVLYGALRAGLV